MCGILQKCLKKLKLFWAFVSVVLYISDISSDALQCKTYYDYGESTEDISVSKWYFVFSMLTWAGPPLCLILFWFISYAFDSNYGMSSYKDSSKDSSMENDLLFTFTRPSWDKKDSEVEPDDDEKTVKEKMEAKNMSCCMKILYGVLEFLFHYLLIAIFAVYVYLPLLVMIPILKRLIGTTATIDEEEAEDFVKKNNAFFQLFEHIGEALPQFSLAVIFYFNNYDYVLKTDFSFEVLGYVVTQTLISLILSAISILKGIVLGLKICCTVKAWKTPQEEMNA